VKEMKGLSGKEWPDAHEFLSILLYDKSSPLYGAQTDENGIVTDPITLEEITEKDCISYEDGRGKVWCFSIASLYDCVQKDKAQNPFTREPLPDCVLEKLKAYEKTENFFSVSVTFLEGFASKFPTESFSFHKGTPYVEILIKILSEHTRCNGDILQRITDYYVMGRRFNFCASLEQEISEDIEIILWKTILFSPPETAAYYRRLVCIRDSCAKRSSSTIQSIANYLRSYLRVKINRKMYPIDASVLEIVTSISPSYKRCPTIAALIIVPYQGNALKQIKSLQDLYKPFYEVFHVYTQRREFSATFLIRDELKDTVAHLRELQANEQCKDIACIIASTEAFLLKH
jgi:hypothetical protein